MTAPKLSKYKNESQANVYTEFGLIAPKAWVELTVTQAKMHKGLVLCKTK